MQEFIEAHCNTLGEEELEKLNAAGAGGFCLLASEAYSAGCPKCSIIGDGIGATWNGCNEPGNEGAGEIAKKVFFAVTKITNGTKPGKNRLIIVLSCL